MTQVFTKISDWINFRKNLNGQLGFVPTMGALHQGHISLIKESKKKCQYTLASIFINPTQFNDPTDLQKYPKTFDNDLKMLTEVGTDFLLYPEYSEIYKDDYRYKVLESKLSKILCGAHRPGHFDGVLTVVLKLLNIAKADYAFFGEKDYQQYLLIKEMVEAFFIDTNIIACPIIREPDGLAMSSRNRLLSDQDRKKAPLFNAILKKDLPILTIKKELQDSGFIVDYVEEHFNRRFGAVILTSTRLIDNVDIKS